MELSLPSMFVERDEKSCAGEANLRTPAASTVKYRLGKAGIVSA
jgi:hypothetical protein